MKTRAFIAKDKSGICFIYPEKVIRCALGKTFGKTANRRFSKKMMWSLDEKSLFDISNIPVESLTKDNRWVPISMYEAVLLM